MDLELQNYYADYVVKKLGENMDLNTIELKKSNKEHEHDRYHDSIQ